MIVACPQQPSPTGWVMRNLSFTYIPRETLLTLELGLGLSSELGLALGRSKLRNVLGVPFDRAVIITAPVAYRRKKLEDQCDISFPNPVNPKPELTCMQMSPRTPSEMTGQRER
eukprot:1343879-Amorphochlora_amoeboformis.AAC.1